MIVLVYSAIVTKQFNPVMHQTQLYTDTMSHFRCVSHLLLPLPVDAVAINVCM